MIRRVGLTTSAVGFLAVFAISNIAFAEVRVQNVRVVNIKAYTSGNMNIGFSKVISAACGDRLRVQAGPGQDSVRTVALSALLSGRPTTVEAESARDGNFCNLISILLADKL